MARLDPTRSGCRSDRLTAPTLQLRSLQTLTEIAGEKNSPIIFPLPIDLIVALTQILHHQANVLVQEPVNSSRRSQRDESVAREAVGATEA